MKAALLFALFLGLFHCDVLNLASFNVQVFGKTKMEHPDVVETLIRIYRLYDVLFMMEIRDSSQTAVYDLLKQLNDGLSPNDQYNLTTSIREGPTTSKEQYGWFFKPSKVRLVTDIQFDDPTYTMFARPPYGVILNFRGRDMFFMGLHDSPDNSTEEIRNYGEAWERMCNDTRIPARYREVIKTTALFMGDLNAGCHYVSKAELDQLRDYWGKLGFKWLISDDTKTMVKTDCPYDRFIARNEMVNYYSGIAPFYYDKEWGLPHDLAVRTSDHYPIHMKINV